MSTLRERAANLIDQASDPSSSLWSKARKLEAMAEQWSETPPLKKLEILGQFAQRLAIRTGTRGKSSSSTPER